MWSSSEIAALCLLNFSTISATSPFLNGHIIHLHFVPFSSLTVRSFNSIRQSIILQRILWELSILCLFGLVSSFSTFLSVALNIFSSLRRDENSRRALLTSRQYSEQRTPTLMNRSAIVMTLAASPTSAMAIRWMGRLGELVAVLDRFVLNDKPRSAKRYHSYSWTLLFHAVPEIWIIWTSCGSHFRLWDRHSRIQWRCIHKTLIRCCIGYPL